MLTSPTYSSAASGQYSPPQGLPEVTIVIYDRVSSHANDRTILRKNTNQLPEVPDLVQTWHIYN